MGKKTLPVGVKIARIMNVIHVTMNIAFFVIFVLSVVSKKNFVPVEALKALALGFGAGLLIWLIIGLGKLNPIARKVQMIVSGF